MDNQPIDAVKKAIEEVDRWSRAQKEQSPRRRADARRWPEVEVSGGVNLDNVHEYAKAGADYISVGALTHSAPALDIALDVTPVQKS